MNSQTKCSDRNIRETRRNGWSNCQTYSWFESSTGISWMKRFRLNELLSFVLWGSVEIVESRFGEFEYSAEPSIELECEQSIDCSKCQYRLGFDSWCSTNNDNNSGVRQFRIFRLHAWLHISVSVVRSNAAKSIPMAAKIALITAAIVVVAGAGVGVGVYFALAGQSPQSFCVVWFQKSIPRDRGNRCRSMTSRTVSIALLPRSFSKEMFFISHKCLKTICWKRLCFCVLSEEEEERREESIYRERETKLD